MERVNSVRSPIAAGMAAPEKMQPSERSCFRDLLRGASTECTGDARTDAATNLGTIIGNGIAKFTAEWSGTEKRISQLLPQLAGDFRTMMSLQRSVHALHLQSELLARAADGVANTVKRLHQMGNG